MKEAHTVYCLDCNKEFASMAAFELHANEFLFDNVFIGIGRAAAAKVLMQVDHRWDSLTYAYDHRNA